MYFLKFILFETIFTDLTKSQTSLEVFKLTPGQYLFTITSANDFKIQETLQQISPLGNDVLSINQNKINFYEFDLPRQNILIDITFNGDCLTPFSMLVENNL